MDIESLLQDGNSEAFSLKYAYGRSLAARAKTKTEYPYSSVSVIIPSRLDRNPLGKLWLDDAVKSIVSQEVRYNLNIEVIIAVDSDADTSVVEIQNLKFAKSDGKSQASALNAGIKMATGDVISFLEDDDIWHPKKLDESLIALNSFDFVSSNQMEFIMDSNGLRLFQKINEYPTPSGWMMTREKFNEIGIFDVAYKYHLDTEWLGRLNRSEMTRCHMVEKYCPSKSIFSVLEHRMRLSHVMLLSSIGSCIWNTNEDHPLVYRAVHPGSGMDKIATDEQANKISTEEHRRIHDVNKNHPW